MALKLDDKPEQDSSSYDNGNPGWYKPGADKLEDNFNASSATDEDLPEGHPDRSKVSSPEQLATAEESASTKATNAPQSESELDSLYHPDSATATRSFWRLRGLSSRKKMLVGLGSGAGIVGLLISAFLAFLPMKINHIVNNLQSHFFASSENAVGRRTEVLFDNYIKRHVLRSLDGSDLCRSTKTIDKSCIKNIRGDTMAGRLFTGWRDAGLENKLANDYGIEFARNPDKSYTLTARGVPEVRFNDSFLNDGRSIGDLVGESTGKAEFRQKVKIALKDALEGETKWKKVMYRFKVGRLLERKYGVRRCLFFCKATDKFSDWGDKKTSAAKLKTIQRVIEPHNHTLGLALGCIFDDECKSAPDPADGSDPERKTKLEKEVQQYLEKRGVTYVDASVEKIVLLTSDILEKGALTALLAELTTKELAGLVSKASTGVGLANVAATVIDTFKNAGPKLKRMAFVINAAAMVNLYVMYRSQADELKNGKVDSALLGSMVSTLGDSAGSKNAYGPGLSNFNQPAEASPLYSNLLGTSSSKTTSLLNIFSPTAFAAATTSPSKYTCDNGKSISDTPGAGLICPEESLLTDNFLTDMSEAFKQEPLATLGSAASAWKDATSGFFGKIADVAGFILQRVPGFSIIQNALGNVTESFFNKIAQWLIPSPISDKMSGGRAFNMIAGGNDVAGNDFAQYGTGAARITDEQAQDIRVQQKAEAQQRFASKPFFQRMFDKEDPGSMVSQIAMSLPTSKTGAMQGTLASIISNPFSKLLNAFGSLFSRPHALAATNDASGPFGIPQYGHVDDTIINQDPDIYTDAYCKKMNDEWANGTGEFTGTLISGDQTATGMDEHTKENPCKLEEAATGAAGGFFTTDVLTKDDLNDPGGGNTSGGGLGISPEGFVFPLITTKSKITSHNPPWCYQNQNNCHHGGGPDQYNAADIFADTGTPVVAAKPGKVLSTKNGGPPGGGHTFGSRVTIKGDDGFVYYYAHMGFNTLKVANGQHVIAGDQLGEVGTNHDAEDTPSHVHFDILPPSYSSRPTCSSAECLAYPFINAQPVLISAFDKLPE